MSVREELKHPWTPVSPCGPWCLPDKHTLPTVSVWRQAGRMCAGIAVLLYSVLLGLILPLFRGSPRQRMIRTLFRAVIRAFGVRMHLYTPGGLKACGTTELRSGSQGVLVVGNHTSWLDVVALNALQPVKMVAKSQVRNWPFIGRLAAKAGTLFLDRDRLSALPEAVAGLADALRGGGVVAVFPEGTTWCGRASGRFRQAPFQAALDAGVPVRPLALRFRLADGSSTTVAGFLGDEGLVTALLRVAKVRGLVLEVYLLPALLPESAPDRRSLAAAAETAITGTLAKHGGDADQPHPLPAASEAA